MRSRQNTCVIRSGGGKRIAAERRSAEETALKNKEQRAKNKQKKEKAKIKKKGEDKHHG